MVGLGEGKCEVLQVMDDLRSADVDFLTIGQYLQPTPKHHVVDRFVTPEEFKQYEAMAYNKGFLMVSASPLTRSSYHAGDDFLSLRAAREAKIAAAGCTSGPPKPLNLSPADPQRSSEERRVGTGSVETLNSRGSPNH